MIHLVQKVICRLRKRRHLRKLYRRLADSYGRKRFYRPRQVESCFRLGGYSNHFHLWLAYAVFCHRSEFDKLSGHEGMVADYQEMRAPFLPTDQVSASASSWDGLDTDFLGLGGDGSSGFGDFGDSGGDF